MITLEMLAIFLFCLVGGMWHSYRTGHATGVKLGKKEGISASLDHLVENGYLKLGDSLEVEESI